MVKDWKTTAFNMKAYIITTAICAMYFLCAECNVYFVTHSDYVDATLDYTAFSVKRISGSRATATQQCRRYCALETLCQAFSVQLQLSRTKIAVYNCKYFALNACNWKVAPLDSSYIPYSVLWDKLPAQTMRPKPCIEYCVVKYLGSCSNCRYYSRFQGLDCDRAPKVCSDHSSTGSLYLPIWPWGFDGRKLDVYCTDVWTNFFAFYIDGVNYTSTSYLGLSGWTFAYYTYSSTTFRTQFLAANWTLLSELVTLAERKKLMVKISASSASDIYYFTGFELSPAGELSLNASQNISAGIPTPLNKAPLLYNSSCLGFSWQFVNNGTICSQTSNFKFSEFRWNSLSHTVGNVYMAFD